MAEEEAAVACKKGIASRRARKGKREGVYYLVVASVAVLLDLSLLCVTRSRFFLVFGANGFFAVVQGSLLELGQHLGEGKTSRLTTLNYIMCMLQGPPSHRHLHVPLPARFCLGSSKSD